MSKQTLPERRRMINPPMNMYRKIAISFIVLTLILIGVVFYFALSYANITVIPATKDITSELSISVTEDAGAADTAQGIFTGEVLAQEVSGSGEFEVTGIKTVQQNATGRVRIVNNYSRQQPLVATTRLVTEDEVLFRIRDGVTVPAGGSVEVDIYADDESEAVNVPSGARMTIPGLFEDLQSLIYAETITPVSGDEISISALTQQEIDAAVEKLSQRLIDDQLNFAGPDSYQVLSKEIVSQEVSEEVGAAVDSFSLDITLAVRGVVLPKETVKAYSISTLEGVVPEGRELVFTDDALLLEVTSIDIDQNTADIRVIVSGKSSISEINEIFDKSKLVGMSRDELIAYLENFESIEAADIKFFPVWISKVPSLHDHIEINIEQPAE